MSATGSGENESRLSASREIKERQCYSLRTERVRERERERVGESMHTGRSRPGNLLNPSPEPRQQTAERTELSQCTSPVRRWWVGL